MARTVTSASLVQAQGEASWLLYDFGPPRAAIGDVTSVLPRCMHMSRCHAFSRQLLRGPPA
eukprot:3986574-Heterocapsa_arctica.AAC.1